MKKEVKWLNSFGRENGDLKNGTYCTTQHLTGIIEEEKTMVFQAIVTIKYDTKDGQKMLKKVMKNLDSPVKLKLQEFDKNNKQDMNENRLYEKYIPNEIIKTIFPGQEED